MTTPNYKKTFFFTPKNQYQSWKARRHGEEEEHFQILKNNFPKKEKIEGSRKGIELAPYNERRSCRSRQRKSIKQKDRERERERERDEGVKAWSLLSRFANWDPLQKVIFCRLFFAKCWKIWRMLFLRLENLWPLYLVLYARNLRL